MNKKTFYIKKCKWVNIRLVNDIKFNYLLFQKNFFQWLLLQHRIILFLAPDNLFGHMKEKLMSKDKQGVCCYMENCKAKWSMQEIMKKADMTKDERIFFEYKVSLNMINQEDADSSECPFCGTYCQRQNQNELHIRCTTCTRRTKKVVEFCWNCKRSWTTNHKCKLYTKHELEQIQRFLNEAPLKVINYSNNRKVPSKRLCPGCGYLIVHEMDCQEMECKKCKIFFCFSCLEVNVKYHSGKNCEVAPVQICSLKKYNWHYNH